MTDLELPDAELSLLLVNDDQIQTLNRQYLHLDKPTNVLAFSMREGEFSVLHPHLLGDIVISVETARRQMKQFNLDETKMIILLLIHGILHLIGYEHEGTKKGSHKMAVKQKELFRQVMQTGIVE